MRALCSRPHVLPREGKPERTLPACCVRHPERRRLPPRAPPPLHEPAAVGRSECNSRPDADNSPPAASADRRAACRDLISPRRDVLPAHAAGRPFGWLGAASDRVNPALTSRARAVAGIPRQDAKTPGKRERVANSSPSWRLCVLAVQPTDDPRRDAHESQPAQQAAAKSFRPRPSFTLPECSTRIIDRARLGFGQGHGALVPSSSS